MALRTPLSVTPHLYMGDSTGRPLDMGTVYFGEPDKDPEFYPIELFSDDALTLPLAQPVHTKGGYLYDKGDMVEPHAKELIYSVKVLDSYGRKVFYKGAMMRNSWNDDVIQQINAAIVGSADVARQVATDITNDAINNTAIEGGVLADTFVTVTANGVGQVARNQRDKNSEYVSVRDYGAIGNGIEHTVQKWIDDGRYMSLQGIQEDYPRVTSLTDALDWAAIQQTIDKHHLVRIPKGDYFINKTLHLRSSVNLQGDGSGTTTISSKVDGGSAIKLNAQQAFGGISDLYLRARNIGTAGHGINAVGTAESDSDTDSQWHSPQHFKYENIRISGYKGGLDESIEEGVGKATMPACGIAQAGGISTKIINCWVSNCGFGIALHSTSTTLALGCVVVDCVYAGVYSCRSTSLVFSRGNIINNGSSAGIVSAKLHYGELYQNDVSGNMVCVDDRFVVVENTRFKNSNTKEAKSDLTLLSCAGALIQGNSFRGSYNAELDGFVSIYCERSRGVTINGNRFSASTFTDTFPTATYKNIVFIQKNLSSLLSSSITNNSFTHLQLKKVSYYIGFLGGSTSKRTGVFNTRIEGNLFGDTDLSAPVEIGSCILVQDTQFYNSTIRHNHCHPSRDFTIGSVVKFVNVDTKKSSIDNNLLLKSTVAEANVGFSGVVYDGIVPDNQYFSHTLTSTTTVPATDSVDIVIPVPDVISTPLNKIDAIFSTPLNGLYVTSWFSAANEVTVRLINNSNEQVELPNTKINLVINRVDDISLGALAY